jgi:hypothetical protein
MGIRVPPHPINGIKQQLRLLTQGSKYESTSISRG